MPSETTDIVLAFRAVGEEVAHQNASFPDAFKHDPARYLLLIKKYVDRAVVGLDEPYEVAVNLRRIGALAISGMLAGDIITREDETGVDDYECPVEITSKSR